MKQHHALTTVVRLIDRPKFQMFSTESNMMVRVVKYLPKSEAAVRRCLQPFTEKRFFVSIFFTKVAGLQPKEKNPARDVFLWVCLIFQNTFFEKHVWLETASTKYLSYSLFQRPHQQSVTLYLGSFLITLYISWVNTVNCLLTAASGGPRQLVELLLIKQVIHSKCS